MESIECQTYPNYEIVVADNASSDTSIECIRENFPRIRLIKNTSNLGFARAANEVEKESRGEYLLFLNMDTWMEPDLIDLLASKIRDNPRIAICGCTQLSYDSKTVLNSGSTTDFLGYPVAPESEKEILYADGASLMIRRKVFEDLGGFDSRYFMYGEEVDLCWRALVAGHDVTVAANARIRHFSGGTVIQRDQTYEVKRFRRYFFERNSLCSLLKNYSLGTLAWVLPSRVVVMSYEIGLLILTGHGIFAIDIARAISWNLRYLRETLFLRGKTQRARRKSDAFVMRRMTKKLAIVIAFSSVSKKSSGLAWK